MHVHEAEILLRAHVGAERDADDEKSDGCVDQAIRQHRQTPGRDEAVQLDHAALGPHAWRQVWRNEPGEELVGLRLGVPDFEHTPLAGVGGAVRTVHDEAVGLLQLRHQRRQHAVVELLGLILDLCGHQYGHVVDS